jgi:DNA-directed RNA polymerase specialized sigma subunit
MTAKEYLSQAYHIDQRINSKLEQVQSLRELVTKATATLSDAPPSGSRNVARMSDIIAKMVDLEEEINADIDDLVDLKAEITAAIKALANPDYAMVLELRYLCFKPWDAIIDRMSYSRPHVFRLHEAALAAIKVPHNHER